MTDKATLYDQVNETKQAIKRLRTSARQANHLADELAKSNGHLIKQLKALEKLT